MAWTFTDGTDYTGPVHKLGEHYYSGETRTTESRRLIEVPDAPKPAPKKAPVKKGKSK